MFKSDDDLKPKQDVQANEPETVIGPSVRVEGNFKGDGNVVIEGEVKGSIKTKRDVRVGERAKIKANIDATNAYVSGEVQGNFKVKEKLELASTAQVTGDIAAKNLHINNGAKINGTIKMDDESLLEQVVHKPKTTSKTEVKPDKKAKKK